MNEGGKHKNNFIGYEYKEVPVKSENVSLYLDAYANFGWVPDENVQPTRYSSLVNISAVKNPDKAIIRLKRDRKIINKAELTRLQHHFEACIQTIEELEKSKGRQATIAAMVTGVIGTAFIAGSVFAVTAEPPIIFLCVLLAIPGFLGWILPYFIYKRVIEHRAETITPIVEQKLDEMYEICEKGNRLL